MFGDAFASSLLLSFLGESALGFELVDFEASFFVAASFFEDELVDFGASFFVVPLLFEDEDDDVFLAVLSLSFLTSFLTGAVFASVLLDDDEDDFVAGFLDSESIGTFLFSLKVRKKIKKNLVLRDSLTYHQAMVLSDYHLNSDIGSKRRGNITLSGT